MLSLKVLVADDDQHVRRFIKDTLCQGGMTVRMAADGVYAVEAIKSGEHFDLLITDYQMPGGPDGFAVIAAAKQALPGIKAVLVTGGGTDIAEATAHGADAVIFKPFQIDRFWKVLNELFPD